MNSFKRYYVVFLLGLWLSISTLAGKVPYFNKLLLEHQLSNSAIQCIFQDSEGYIWFGSNDGLNRFDGYNVTQFNYNFQDSTSIGHGIIRDIFEDSNSDIWVSTWGGGLARFDRKTETFIKYVANPSNQSNLINNHVNKLLQDSKGNYWVGTLGGLDKFNPKTGEFERVQMEGQRRYPVVTIFESSSNDIWVGCSNSLGLFKLDKEAQILEQHKIQGEICKESNNVNAVFELGKEQLLIGTGCGLFFYNTRTEKFENLSINDINDFWVSFILEKEPGILWIGTQNRGLIEFDIFNRRLTVISYISEDGKDLYDYSFMSGLKDRDENIWLGTFEEGVLVNYKYSIFLFQSAQEPLIQYLKGNYINFITRDRKGNYWVAVREKGIYLFSEKADAPQIFEPLSIKSSLSNNRVRFILEDHKGLIWIATENGGLDIYNPESKRFDHYLANDSKLGIPSSKILSLAQDKNLDIWIGTVDQGIFIFSYKNKVFEKFQLPYRQTNIPFIFPDGNEVLISIMGLGLCRYHLNEKSFKLYDRSGPDSLSHTDVFSISKSRDGKIWISTAGGGLNCLDPETEKFTWYGEKDGLADNVVWSAIEDNNGLMWISTNNGLSCFNPGDETFQNFTQVDGLLSNEFVQQSSYIDSDGIIYYGSNKGLIKFNPEDLDSNPLLPEIKITSLNYIFRDSKNVSLSNVFSPSGTIRIDYKVLGFNVSFIAFNYISSKKNSYSYLLEGFENEWHDTNIPVSMTYTNIRPGEYTFRIRAANNDGLWNMKGQSIDIIVNPSPWKSSLAYFIYSSIILTILFFTSRILLDMYKSKKVIAEERKEKLREKELSDLKLQFFTDISHELKTPLTLIFAPLQRILESEELNDELKVQLKYINKNTSRLLFLINRLMDFRKLDKGYMKLEVALTDFNAFMESIIEPFELLANIKRISFRHEGNMEENQIYFDSEKLGTILYNLLSNAFKFNKPNGEIHLRFQKVSFDYVVKNYTINLDNYPVKLDSFAEFIVKDTGIGIDEKDISKLFSRFYYAHKSNESGSFSSGIGLSYTYNLIKLHKGDIIVKSKAGEGSTFSFVLPVDNKAFTENELVNKEPFSVTLPLSGDLPLADVVESEIYLDTNLKSKILIVEDHPEMVNMLVDIFKNDYQIEVASNGEEGLEKVEVIHPDLIISDIMMPVMNGIDLCVKLKNDFNTCHIPVILLTAKSEISSTIEGIESGADAYINKPFYPKHLLALVSNLLENREKLRQVFAKGYLPDTKICKLNNLDKKFIDEVKELMESNYTDSEFTVDRLCEKLSLSRMTLYRKFSSLTNHSPSDFIRTFRLNKAAKLLEEENYSISEICYMVGFTTPTNFSVSFSRHFSLPPSEYREKYGKAAPSRVDLI